MHVYKWLLDYLIVFVILAGMQVVAKSDQILIKWIKAKCLLEFAYHKNTKQSKYINILRGNIAHIT